MEKTSIKKKIINFPEINFSYFLIFIQREKKNNVV